ncbi:MAG: hypothetical protein NC212_04585 [Staphylococcus sp.]|nr:hypothetical protein [Staphylococcus sp.]
MIKQLLAGATLLAATFTTSATTIKVWEGTKNLTGWGDNISVQASELTAAAEGAQIVLNLTVDLSLNEADYCTIGIKTNVDGWPELDGTSFQNPQVGDAKAEWTLNAAAADQLKNTGLIVQGINAIVSSIDLVTAEDVNPNILFDGELVLSGWNHGATISAAKLKVGDGLRYTFSNSGSASAQVLVKNSSWANLLGTSKITPNDMATGSVTVGVTEQMLANAGGSIFVQGDGGCVITKLELVPGLFDATDVLTYGERIPGVSIYTTIPENTAKIAVLFASKPTWAQLCNSSWTAFVTNDDATVTENPDGTVVMTFPLTAENIAEVNAKQELIVNTDANMLSVYIPSEGTTGIATVVVDNENAPVEYFNLQGVRVNNPENGIYIRRQGNTATKVLVK